MFPLQRRFCFRIRYEVTLNAAQHVARRLRSQDDRGQSGRGYFSDDSANRAHHAFSLVLDAGRLYQSLRRFPESLQSKFVKYFVTLLRIRNRNQRKQRRKSPGTRITTKPVSRCIINLKIFRRTHAMAMCPSRDTDSTYSMIILPP